MISIEEKITSFQQENEEAKSAIVRGSDEHLDILLQIKKLVGPLTERFSNLMNESLIPGLNNFSTEQIEILIPKLLDLYSSSIQIVAILKKGTTAKDLKTTCQNYYSNVEDLREFIYDLEHFRVNSDDELDEILKEINIK